MIRGGRLTLSYGAKMAVSGLRWTAILAAMVSQCPLISSLPGWLSQLAGLRAQLLGQSIAGPSLVVLDMP